MSTAWKLECLLAAISLVALSGCADEEWVDFRYLTDAPAAVDIDSDAMTIPAGLAVGVEAIPVVNGDRVGLELDMVPVRPGVIGIAPSLEERHWVIWGIAEGSTEIDLYFDDEFVGTMPASVGPPRPVE